LAEGAAGADAHVTDTTVVAAPFGGRLARIFGTGANPTGRTVLAASLLKYYQLGSDHGASRPRAPPRPLAAPQSRPRSPASWSCPLPSWRAW
jgi:hypothetical protein